MVSIWMGDRLRTQCVVGINFEIFPLTMNFHHVDISKIPYNKFNSNVIFFTLFLNYMIYASVFNFEKVLKIKFT